ncbi:MAG TPA: hypothetical protein VFI73_11375 [Candidatus Nitrosopolaris sp.]|nr:hypothetical protein [Candidatus Nitrosopolaris sp.]
MAEQRTMFPLTQLLHRLYWLKVNGLRVTARARNRFVNFHPIKQYTDLWDYDGVINRNNDITFSDRTTRASGFVTVIRLRRSDTGANQDHKISWLKYYIDNLFNSNVTNHGLTMKP